MFDPAVIGVIAVLSLMVLSFGLWTWPGSRPRIVHKDEL